MLVHSALTNVNKWAIFILINVEINMNKEQSIISSC